MKKFLTIEDLIKESKNFCEIMSVKNHFNLIGVTDGKAVGTYIEHNFKNFLQENYNFSEGNSAKGIDFPDENILTDIKVTSVNQPQSSCLFQSARQKIFGLGYNLPVFVYDKIDSFLSDRNIPGDEIILENLSEEILKNPPEQGYLTISNALQWRLQYSRVISLKNSVSGVINYDR